MKYFGVFLTLVALVAAEEDLNPSGQMDPYQVIHTDCAKKSGVTPEQAAKIAVFEYPNDEQVHKYVLCIVNMDVFNYQRYILLAKSNVAETEKIEKKEILDKCIENNIERRNLARWAYRVLQCMLNSEVGEAMKNIIKANRELNARKAAAETPKLD